MNARVRHGADPAAAAAAGLGRAGWRISKYFAAAARTAAAGGIGGDGCGKRRGRSAVVRRFGDGGESARPACRDRGLLRNGALRHGGGDAKGGDAAVRGRHARLCRARSE